MDYKSILNFAYSEHEKKSSKIGSKVIKFLTKPLMFNGDFRYFFFSGLKSQLEAGISIGDFLKGSLYSARELKSKKEFFYDDVLSTKRTTPVYICLKPYFPSQEISIFSAGETGTKKQTAKACEIVIDYMKLDSEIKSAIKVMITLLSLYVSAFTLFLVFFGKNMATAVDNLRMPYEKLPEVTKTFIDMNQFIQDYILFIVLGMLSIVCFFIYYLPKGSGRIREFLQSYIPVFKFYRQYTCSTFLLSLSSMLGAGMPFTDAMKVLQKTSNKYLVHYISKIIKRKKGGGDEKKSLDVGLMEKEMYFNICQFIQGKNIGESLFKAAEFRLIQLRKRIQKIQRVAMLILLVLGGTMIVYGYKAIIEPANSYRQSMGRY